MENNLLQKDLLNIGHICLDCFRTAMLHNCVIFFPPFVPQVISVAKAKRFLLELGHNYTSNSILQSELRILKTLGFHVAVLSPLDYVETILQVLGAMAFFSANTLPLVHWLVDWPLFVSLL